MISQEEKNRIIGELNKRFSSSAIKCPMCGNSHFIIADGYFNPFIQDNITGFTIGGASIPSISIICSKCGFMSQHALGILGLLPKTENEKAKEGENEQ